jgi:hypothetical protein
MDALASEPPQTTVKHSLQKTVTFRDLKTNTGPEVITWKNSMWAHY